MDHRRASGRCFSGRNGAPHGGPGKKVKKQGDVMNKISYKPEGYQSVIPYLHATGATKLIAFMKEVFDAQEIAIYPRPDGTVGHAALRIGDSVLELADAGYHRALKAGATSIIEPADQFYGDRTASVRDSCGNNWYIATQKEIVSK